MPSVAGNVVVRRIEPLVFFREAGELAGRKVGRGCTVGMKKPVDLLSVDVKSVEERDAFYWDGEEVRDDGAKVV